MTPDTVLRVKDMVYKYAVFGTLVRNKVKIVYSVPHVRIEIKAAILSIKKERDFGPHFSYTVLNLIMIYKEDCMFLCLFGVFRSTREFFTHMNTSPLPVKGYARLLWPLSTPTVTRSIRL